MLERLVWGGPNDIAQKEGLALEVWRLFHFLMFEPNETGWTLALADEDRHK
jgi:hypothetical protein